MRVAVTGAHATGKTTLIDAVACKLRQQGRPISVVKEVARELILLGVPLNDRVDADSCIKYIKAQLSAYRSSSGTEMLCDRSLLDLLAYISATRDSSLPSHYLEMLTELVAFESKLFDYYVYVPIEFPLILDDVRPSDVDFQHRVDYWVAKLLKELTLPMITVSGDLQQRVKTCLDVFQSPREGCREV